MKTLFKIAFVLFALFGMAQLVPAYFPQVLGIVVVVGGFGITYMMAILAVSLVTMMKVMGKS